MEVYDELASCSSDEDDYSSDDNDSLYESSPVRKSACQVVASSKVAGQNSGHDKENKNPMLAASFLNLLRDGEDGKKVTVEQCKDYLRAHGLRLTGTKSVLVERINGHIQEQENNDITSSKPIITSNNNGALRNSDDPVVEDLVKSFVSIDLDHVNNTTTMEFLKDEKKLTVQDCKVYLRKHGLRLTGTKQVLIERIREHLQIQDDSGKTRYPEDTFTINCQGDACIGDVVLFKQRVYESFNGPPVGVRTIAGRIIKESYGSAKQQHTFTVEVLWSTGDKALPPMHPLIIKGRNLYRVNTLRQAWADEKARLRQLQEKHARGAAARREREARIEGRYCNGYFKKHEMKIHKVDNNDGANLKYENGSNNKDPFTKLGRNTELAVEMGAYINTNNGPVCKPGALMTDAAKSDHRCRFVHPLHGFIGSAHAVNVDPLCTYDTLAHAAKVNMVSSTSTIHAKVYDPFCSIEVKFDSFLAGLIIGKNGTNLKEIVRLSGAELGMKRDPVSPTLCIVRIRGTVQQRDTVLKMVYQKVCCKFFAQNGECRYGDTCKFFHALVN